MLSIRINKSATIQMDIAAAFISVLPNRLEAARSAALEKAKAELKARIPEMGRPAKYIIISIEGFGPIGASIKLSPPASNRSSKHGYDRGKAAEVFMGGRRGGKVVTGRMKLRPGSVASGYPKYLKKFKLSKLKSHKVELSKLTKEVVLNNLKVALRNQGFGARGGNPQAMSNDTPRPVGV